MAKTVVRFDGYVDGFPVAWAGGVTEQSRVRISALDRMSRFTSLRMLRDPLLEELGTAANSAEGFVLDRDALDDGGTLAGGVQWLYGMQEQFGAVTAGDVSGAPGRHRLTLTQSGTDGEVAFGSAGLMPEGTAVTFTPESAGNGLTLGHDDVMLYCGTEWSMWCQFAWSGDTNTQLVALGGAMASVVLTVTATTVTARLTSQSGATATATKTVPTNDNAPHWAHVTVAGTSVRLTVDTLSAAPATAPTDMGTLNGLTIGTLGSSAVQIAWVGAASSSTSDARAQELGTLATGGAERSDLRVARWLRWVGLEDDLAAETGLSDVAYIATGGRPLLDCVADLNGVEGGVLFPSGAQIVFHSRDHRYNPDSYLTLDATDIDSSLSVQIDTARLVNDYTASRPRGATYRAHDAQSVLNFGLRPNPRDNTIIYAATDSDLTNAADWYVGTYGTLAPYVASITLDLMTLPDAVVGPAMGTQIGARVNVTGLPTNTPGGGDLDLFVEGIADEISTTSWKLTWNTSPAINYQAGVLDSTTNAQLDSTARLVY